MRKRNTKYEFAALLFFLIASVLLLTNGFAGRILAEEKEPDVYRSVEPIGVTLSTILKEYVRDVEIDNLVEGGLEGIMASLDRNSSYISTNDLLQMREDTKGEFEGIGVQIKMDEEGRVLVFTPIGESPAAEAGLQPFDRIVGIDGVPTADLWTEAMTDNEKLGAAADKIRGPRGTTVNLTLWRPKDGTQGEEIEVRVKRDRVPLESITEARLLDGGIGYVRIKDFKENTADDLRAKLKEFTNQGMTGLVLDLRWNLGGLLNASQQVCELFLAKNSLVTYTRSRPREDGKPNPQDMELVSGRRPSVPLQLPLLVLANEITASSAEIVTGALQYHKRAIVVGEKTFGKGSVQTIIPIPPERETALRLTTALYYTPAGVTIDHQGILPDVAVEMSKEEEQLLAKQMYRSYKDDATKMNEQNHGSVTGNPVTSAEGETEEDKKFIEQAETLYGEDTGKIMREAIRLSRLEDQTIDDTQLKRAVEILHEDPLWEKLLEKYHLDVLETQVAASAEEIEKLSDSEQLLLNGANPNNGSEPAEATEEQGQDITPEPATVE